MITVEQLTALGADFLANGSDGQINAVDLFEMENRCSTGILSAPHATNTFVNGKRKKIDLFTGEIVSAFRDDAEVIKIGSFTLKAYAVAFPLNSIIVMCNMLFQSTGKTLSASFMASARQGLFLIPCIWILDGAFGLTGLQLAQCTADFLTFGFAIPLLINYLKSLKKEEVSL